MNGAGEVLSALAEPVGVACSVHQRTGYIGKWHELESWDGGSLDFIQVLGSHCRTLRNLRNSAKLGETGLIIVPSKS